MEPLVIEKALTTAKVLGTLGVITLFLYGLNRLITWIEGE